MVRVNSLRCWNCGAFMNPEVEEKYLELQSKPQETIYSQVPAGEVSALDDSSAESAEDEVESDDDYELNMPIAPVVSGKNGDETPAPLPLDPANLDAAISKPTVTSDSPTTGSAGDDLFDIAMRDEKELQKQRKKRAQRGGQVTPGGGLIIFCPYGCRVVVKESHRGMQGKCPECKAPFIVPVNPPDFRKEKDKSAATEKVSQVGGFDRWLNDLHLHTVSPEKLKIKADSLLKDFTQADFGFSDDEMIVAIYSKKAKGLLGGAAGKGDPREELKEQLRSGKKLKDIELGEKYTFTKSQLSGLKVVQPVTSRADSIFHGIAVFGEGRISIQLPSVEGKSEILYVSMGITQFWVFKAVVEEKYGISNLGANSGIPSEYVYTTHRCQILETPVKALENIELYKVDESVQLETVGYQCGKCQIVVSEEGRARDSLGGKSPKGIAKAKCPKCSNKMGENLLYHIKAKPVEEVQAT